MAWERLQEEVAELFVPEFTIQDEVVAFNGRILGKSLMERPTVPRYTRQGQTVVAHRHRSNAYCVRRVSTGESRVAQKRAAARIPSAARTARRPFPKKAIA